MNALQVMSRRRQLVDQALPAGTPVLAWVPGGARPGVVKSWRIEACIHLVYEIEFTDLVRAMMDAACIFDARNLAARPAASYAPHGSRS